MDILEGLAFGQEMIGMWLSAICIRIPNPDPEIFLIDYTSLVALHCYYSLRTLLLAALVLELISVLPLNLSSQNYTFLANVAKCSRMGHGSVGCCELFR